MCFSTATFINLNPSGLYDARGFIFLNTNYTLCGHLIWILSIYSIFICFPQLPLKLIIKLGSVLYVAWYKNTDKKFLFRLSWLGLSSASALQ